MWCPDHAAIESRLDAALADLAEKMAKGYAILASLDADGDGSYSAREIKDAKNKLETVMEAIDKQHARLSREAAAAGLELDWELSAAA